MSEWVSFAEIKQRVKLAPVLTAYGVDWLRRSGGQQYRGRCPIHGGEGTEAFHANLERGVFHCFACGAGGNVLDFVAGMEGCSVREAALHLQASHLGRSAARAAASRPGPTKLVTKKRETNPPLGFSLAVDSTHPYLARRGMDPATMDYFGVGHYRGRGLMRGRVVIPIHDHRSRLVAYCGRAVDDATPRYRFPEGFQKSQVLFNYHRVEPMAGAEVILVEGFFDCMRVHQAGCPAVVALMGARCSPAQQKLLLDRFYRIVLMLDGDATGRAATAQIASDLAPARSVMQVLLPADRQPDQMSADQIRQALQRAERGQEIGPN